LSKRGNPSVDSDDAPPSNAANTWSLYSRKQGVKQTEAQQVTPMEINRGKKRTRFGAKIGRREGLWEPQGSY
jgi:hypothetical protein